MKDKLIVALDVDSFEKAGRLIDILSPYVNIFKVGSQLFVNSGPSIVEYINRKKKKVFLDLKFYDIPNTVEKACIEASRHKVFMLTIHSEGGPDMLKRAVRCMKKRKKRPLLVGVTVLTSKEDKDAKQKVLELAKVSKKAGLNGIVCSSRETWLVKKTCGKNFIVVNPGIRPKWYGKDDLSSEAKHGRYLAKEDQKRVATPEEALKNGADFIVIGRPITEAQDPAMAVERILA